MSEEIKDIATVVLEKEKKSTLIKIIIGSGSLIFVMSLFIINILIKNYKSNNERVLEVVRETSQIALDSISNIQKTVHKIENVQGDMVIRIDTIGRRVSINTFILGELIKRQDNTTKTIIENVQRGFEMAKPSSYNYIQPKWDIDLATVETPVIIPEKEIEKKN